VINLSECVQSVGGSTDDIAGRRRSRDVIDAHLPAKLEYELASVGGLNEHARLRTNNRGGGYHPGCRLRGARPAGGGVPVILGSAYIINQFHPSQRDAPCFPFFRISWGHPIDIGSTCVRIRWVIHDQRSVLFSRDWKTWVKCRRGGEGDASIL